SAPGLITTEPRPASSATPSAPMSRRHKLAIAVGALALASGGAALSFELSSRSTYDASTREPDDARQNALYDSANRKYELAQGFALGAAACALGAAVMWVTDHPEDRAATITLTPTTSGLSLSLAGR